MNLGCLLARLLLVLWTTISLTIARQSVEVMHAGHLSKARQLRVQPTGQEARQRRRGFDDSWQNPVYSDTIIRERSMIDNVGTNLRPICRYKFSQTTDVGQ